MATGAPARREAPSQLPPDDDTAFARVCREADAIARERGYPDAPPHFKTLLWIDSMCVEAGMHALDLWWLGTLLVFYASGKLVLVVRCGLRGAKSVSICRSLVNDALFGHCGADQSTVGVIPIMSADRTEATDRFHTIKAILSACGVGERRKKGEEEDFAPLLAPGGLGMTYKSSTLPSGGGVITIEDVDGREVQFRIYPARLSGVIGHTDKSGFGDELDTWPVDLGVSAADVAQRSASGRANPADVVLDRWLERFTTTLKTAHLYLVSASYFGEDTAHARKVAEGDTPIQMVARLGDLGAARDNAARTSLAKAIGSPDRRLLAPADPFSPNVPAWVTSPAASIEDCFALSRMRLGPMFGRYGGRPDEAEGGRGPLAGIEIPIDERSAPCLDVAIGVSPPDEDSAEWGIVAAGLSPTGGILVLEDASGAIDGREAAGRVHGLCVNRRASVLAVAAEHARRVEVEVLAAFAGAGIALAPVAPQDVKDTAGLRVGPLRTLYQRGSLRHAEGLGPLAVAANGWLPDRRSPRVEALVAAVARLVACYPWLEAKDEEPMRGPRAVASGLEASGLRGMDLVRKLGGR